MLHYMPNNRAREEDGCKLADWNASWSVKVIRGDGITFSPDYGDGMSRSAF
jgi:hypothetical protein